MCLKHNLDKPFIFNHYKCDSNCYTRIFIILSLIMVYIYNLKDASMISLGLVIYNDKIYYTSDAIVYIISLNREHLMHNMYFL